MKKRILAFVLTLAMLLSIMPAMDIHAEAAETLKAETADFISRSDGVWLFPLDKAYYNSFADWAGCNGDNSCCFHPGNDHGGCSAPHETKNGFGHNGIDIGVKVGQKVYASADGILYCTSKDWASRGITAVVEHKAGKDAEGKEWSYYTIYQHLSSVVSSLDGKSVKAGDVIAYTGKTDGYGTGRPHLHFGMVLAASGKGYAISRDPNSVLSAIENKGWIKTAGYQEGRVLLNPARNSPEGYPTGGAAAENLKIHAGSVMYTFDRTQVSIGENNFTYKNYFHCDVTFKITTAAYAWTLPGSDQTYPDSEHVSETMLPVGTKLQATAIYENDAKSDGHYWYETKIDGKTAYVYVPYTEHVSTNWSISVASPSKPTQVTLKDGFGIYGVVSTGGSKIKTITGYVYPGDTITGTPTIKSSVVSPNSLTYNLNKEVNNTLIFNDIQSTGYYTYVVKAVLTSYSFKDGSAPKLETSAELELKDTRSYFQVVEANASCSHSYTNVVIAPTCTAQGFTTYTCSKCGHSYRDNYTEPKAHSYGDWVVTNSATCTAEGAEKRSCTGCGDMQTQSIPALGHYYEAKQINATCMQYAYVRYTCTRCGDSYDERGGGYTEWSTTKPSGVNESLIETKTEYRYQTKQFTTAATAALEGWVHCGTTTQWGPYGEWSQWSGTAVTASDSVQVETATIYGYYHYTCTNCGKRWPAYGSCWTKAGGCGAKTIDNFTFFWSEVSWDTVNFQYWDYDSIKPGKYYTNYFDDGVWYKWSNNGQPKTGYRYRSRNLETIHQFYRWSAWSDWNETPVSASDTVNVETRTVYRYLQSDLGSHDYQIVVTEPTCTEQGYTIYTCKVCGDSYKSNIVDPKGHSYGIWYNTQEPTCTQSGIKRRDCTACNHYETEAVPVMEHQYNAVVTAPDCVDQGYTTYSCACGNSYVDSFVDALGHNYESGACTHCGHEDPDKEAPNASKIVIDTVVATPGKMVTVTVKLENNPGISAVVMKIVYDDTKLQLVGAQFAEDVSQNAQANYNLPYVTLIRSGNYAEDATLLTLTFVVLDDAEEGIAYVTLEYDKGNITNYDEENVEFSVIAGGVTVISHIPGDINGDGVVNSKDLTRLLKYISHEEVEVNDAALDVNGDGEVNSKDLTRLLKYISHEDVEIY